VPDRRLLVIDTATRQAVVALADFDGALVALREWHSPHRHGEQLLLQLDALLAEAGVSTRELAAVAAGTGPGSFTGLRIGLASAKVVAYTIGCSLVGLSTTAALAAAIPAEADEAVAVVLPAGASDRYVARYRGPVELLAPVLRPAGQLQASLERGDLVAAIDLDDELGVSAAELGRRAQAGLAGALAQSAAQAIAAGRYVGPEVLVPSYVALPRGVAVAHRDSEWSPDLR
jgi:tRNA threonylcarbamoyladenosine biosynthesis protein TsaB